MGGKSQMMLSTELIPEVCLSVNQDLIQSKRNRLTLAYVSHRHRRCCSTPSACPTACRTPTTTRTGLASGPWSTTSGMPRDIASLCWAAWSRAGSSCLFSAGYLYWRCSARTAGCTAPQPQRCWCTAQMGSAQWWLFARHRPLWGGGGGGGGAERVEKRFRGAVIRFFRGASTFVACATLSAKYRTLSRPWHIRRHSRTPPYCAHRVWACPSLKFTSVAVSLVRTSLRCQSSPTSSCSSTKSCIPFTFFRYGAS